MSDNIPVDIQRDIIKKVYDVKSLIRMRSVSKRWKSFIESSQFIKGYGARQTQPPSRILTYEADLSSWNVKSICLVDDDTETLKVQEQEFVVSPLLPQCHMSLAVGSCDGLLCFYGLNETCVNNILVIWNPFIRKSFGVAVVFKDNSVFGFGVCPVTRDPILVKLLCPLHKPWHAEVFTLSSGVWNMIPSGNLHLPSQTIRLNNQVVIDRFIYWGAFDSIPADNGEVTKNHMLVSFDLITNEFNVVDLPDTLTNEVISPGGLVMGVSVSELRGSLVVYGPISVEGADCCGVWVMERDRSFTKLYTILARVSNILGFTKSGETIIEVRKEEGVTFTTLDFYDPCSKHIKALGIGISGVVGSFFMGSPRESLLLVDHSDLHVYSDDS
ncbi:probable LRR receptor-like serine/threonine-protein kinase isoform X2 [Tanacetum coccineum]|uniref:Probable LRR receptor-like serine/threonine-protein kinase isoform X2 n=1 Tax=Tanacetum coccineum TaxID=301880 RepID=A0ABQ5G254_9ASTR